MSGDDSSAGRPDPAPEAAVEAVVQGFVAGLEGVGRQVARGEWGLTLEAGGWPLHVGLLLRGGLLRAHASVVGPGRLDPAALLFDHRDGPYVRYARTLSGEVLVRGELPAAALDAAELDRLLGLVGAAAERARAAAR